MALVTCGMLAIWRLAAHVPLPGLDMARLSHQVSSSGIFGLERLSIVALGIIPWLSAAVMVEMAVLLIPQSKQWRLARSGHADPMSLPVIIIALLLAVFQAYGVSEALQNSRFTLQDNALSGLAVMASLVGGVVMLMALAHLINRHGLGRGFWLLAAAQFAIGTAGDLAIGFRVAQMGAIPPAILMANATMIVACIGALAWLLLLRSRTGGTSFEDIIWPGQIASLAAGWFLAFVMAALAEPSIAWPSALTIWVMQACVMGVFVTLIAALYAKRTHTGHLLAATALVLAAVASLPLLAQALWNLPIPINSMAWAMMTGVAFAACKRAT